MSAAVPAGLVASVKAIVAESGEVGPENATLASVIMGEELEEFASGTKYANERALLSEWPALAVGSLSCECLKRIVAAKELLT